MTRVHLFNLKSAPIRCRMELIEEPERIVVSLKFDPETLVLFSFKDQALQEFSDWMDSALEQYENDSRRFVFEK